MSDPTTVWGRAAEAVGWITAPTAGLADRHPPVYRGVRGGGLHHG